jgi:hypothetical protein
LTGAVDAFEQRIPECEALGVDRREMWRMLNTCGMLPKSELDMLRNLYGRAKQLPR